MTGRSSQALRDALAFLAGYGLAGSRRPAPGAPLDPTTWSRVLEAAESEHLTGMLVAAIADGAFPATDEQVKEVRARNADALATNVELEHHLLEVAEQLDAEGIEFRVLDGPAHAHIDYEAPALRYFSDVHILVRSEDFEPAVRTLERPGRSRSRSSLHPAFDGRFAKGVTVSGADTPSVHVHRTLVAGPLGLAIDRDALFDESESFVVADRKLEGLATEKRFLDACFRVALSRPAPLRSQRDVAQLALSHELDAEHALDLARQWRAEPVVARAVDRAWFTLDLADAVPLSAWATHRQPGPRDGLLIDAYCGGETSARHVFATSRWIPRRRDRLAYVCALFSRRGAKH